MVAIGEPARIIYTNYRGETAERAITPKRVWYGISDWHPRPQWFLTAFDHDKNADRDFALIDFGHPQPSAAPHPLDDDANPLASNPVDDKIAPDTDGNAPAATDTGLVTVLPLEWRKYRNGDAEAVTPFGEIYTAYVNGYWRVTRNGKAGKFIKATGGDDVEAAKSGAQADVDANVLSLVRSLAEELLASETELKQHWKDEAERFRIEFEKVAYDWRLSKVRVEAIEAKLVAAEEVAQLVIQAEEDKSGDPNFYILLMQTAYDKARTVLGGEGRPEDESQD
ncbi:hypothetical protein BG46_10785 [Brucella anthropi]|uniref:hypothetical protein n=1 Tax=Brucella anthropi TaxID=529 RepID=UPI0004461C67|nr:hypothetical protein [Brucella anthropi]EXL07395.1 hypothetical protein BG46_10785 [Brucella anthropi]